MRELMSGTIRELACLPQESLGTRALAAGGVGDPL
jgi:hypothetical protein